MKALSIDEMKQVELDIMVEIDRVCRECGIVYYLAYGSLLGAMRHGGFIPWDDDMDIVMFRDDYERFYEMFPEACNDERFQLVSYRDESSSLPFIKVTNRETRVEERYAEKQYGTGVWVDVFPLDFIPEKGGNAIFRKNGFLEALRYLAVTKVDTGATSLIKLAKRVVCPLVKKANPHALARMMDKNAQEAHEEGNFVSYSLQGGDPSQRFPKSAFFPAKEIDFEDKAFMAPNDPDRLLTISYGDWRTPPPEGVARETHSYQAYWL